MSRNRYTTAPAPVVAELLETAGDRAAVLQEAVGTWIGFYEDDYVQPLCDALRVIPGVDEWIVEGARRRAIPDHRTPSAREGVSWPRRE